jgi:hypothetical protein
MTAPYIEWHCAEWIYAGCRYGKCHYAECRYGECNYAECRGSFPQPITLKVVTSRDEKSFFCSTASWIRHP